MALIISCSSKEDNTPGKNPIKGCTDSRAKNYDPEAIEDDNTCSYENDTTAPVGTQALPKIMAGTSGLLFYKNKLVTFNDHKDTKLYYFDPGAPDEYHTDSLPGVTNEDWEEVQQDKRYFYIGDIGNNVAGNRENLKFYRIKKSELENNPKADEIAFSYETQTDFTKNKINQTDYDAEAFIVTNTHIYIFTKEWLSEKTSVYKLDKNPGDHVAKHRETFDVEGLITGAAYFKDKNLIVLSGYSKLIHPFVYLLYDYKNDNFFKGKRQKIAIDLPGHQVEGIATKDGLYYYISNESLSIKSLDKSIPQKLHEIDLSRFLSDYVTQ